MTEQHAFAPNHARRSCEVARGAHDGGIAHARPFLISDISTARTVAYVVVSIELVVIARVRKRFLNVALRTSLIQVTLGGFVVAAVGVIVGNA